MIFYLTGTRGGDFGAKIEKKLEKVFELCVLELNLSRFRGVVHARMPRKKGLLEKWRKRKEEAKNKDLQRMKDALARKGIIETEAVVSMEEIC